MCKSSLKKPSFHCGIKSCSFCEYLSICSFELNILFYILGLFSTTTTKKTIIFKAGQRCESVRLARHKAPNSSTVILEVLGVGTSGPCLTFK